MSPEGVKKAYHAACLVYHPDKTGRGEEDKVFLTVKAAFDTLSDQDKKRTYDSSDPSFDDSIPPANLPERKFYAAFDECFRRNTRFAVTKNTAASGKKGRKGKRGNKTDAEESCPPFGDDDTPIEQVEAFYSWWVRFESWRDFTLAASKKCKHNLDGAEGREEKRWMMKDIERESKKMKAAEVKRISDLVDRARSMDPRLKRFRDEQAAAKAKAKDDANRAEREAKEAAEAAAADAAREAEEAEAERKMKAANLKAAKDKEKKALRKVKQLFRKLAMAAFEAGGEGNWKDLTEQNEEVEFLAEKLGPTELPALSEALGGSEESLNVAGVAVVRAAYVSTKNGLANEYLEREAKKVQARKEADEAAALEKARRAPKPWTQAEHASLAKAVKKYPAGGANRWEIIAQFINSNLALPVPRSKEECISEYNSLLTAQAKRKEEKDKDTDKKKYEEKKEEMEKTQGEAQRAPKVDPSVWTNDEIKDLETALKKFSSKMEKNARWNEISKFVATKTKRQCVEQFKAMRAKIKGAKKG